MESQRNRKDGGFPFKGRKRRIIIAGGGTGGHIFPAIAIANALKKKESTIEILFVGAKGKMEMDKVPLAGYPIKGIDIVGFSRSSLIKNLALPFRLIMSFFQVRRIIKEFRPDAVVGVGGYSSFPLLRYAQAIRIPSFIHESNSFAGKSNILLGKKATRVFVASDGMERFFPSDKILITGNPVRSNIVANAITRDNGVKFFGLDPAKKTVLVTGGSLGAKGINEAIDATIDEFGKHDMQLIWQTGKTYMGRAQEVAKGKENIWVNDFIVRMECAFAAADVVVSRAGAMAIAELCVVKKAVVFVPFPFASENHQTVNASKLVSKNAGLMVQDDEAKEKLTVTVIKLVNDKEKQEQLKENIGKLAVTNADEVIAAEILNEISS